MPDLDQALCQGGVGTLTGRPGPRNPVCVVCPEWMTCPSEDGEQVPQRRDACHNFTANIHNYSNNTVLLVSPHAPVSLFLGSMRYPPSETGPSWLSDPLWHDTSIEELQERRILEPLNLRKRKLYRHTQASTGISVWKTPGKKFGNGLAVRPPHPLYPHSPSHLYLGKQLWLMTAVTNKTTVVADVALGGIFPWENQPAESLQVLNFYVRALEFNNSC